MSVKKIEFDGKTLIDLTKDTVTAGSMLSGVKAHNNEGDIITGNIPTKTAVDLTVNGKTVTVPAGYYGTKATKDVADGTAGVPLAVKGVVTGNQIAITPKVTNTTGYITGGEKVGSNVIVKASDLVSGNKALASSSTKQENIDVTNFSTVSIDAIPTSPLTNAIIKSCTMNPTSEPGDEDTARVVVQIPEGFHASQTIQKDFEDLLPGLENPGGADQALNGYKYYDDTGNMITGTMANNGAVTYDLNDVNKSYTIPKGFHDGKGVVSHTTTNIPNPTMAFNSSTKKVTASGSWTKGYTSNSAYSAAYEVTLDDAKEVTGIGSVAMPTNISKSGATISTGTGTITLTAPMSINATLNKGYIDSASKSYNVTAELEANVNTLAAKDYHPSTSDSVIPQGSYLTGKIVFKGVTTSGIQASNIIKGAVVKVGDNANSGSIANVTGTADYIKTVSSVPTSKDTSIIYNSGDGNFYVWRA